MFNPLSRYLGRRLQEHRRGGLLHLRDIVPTRRYRLEGEMRRRAQFAYLGDHVGLCRVLGRFKMYVDTRDIGLSSHLALDGYWELWVTEFLAKTLRRGTIAVDVGANLGYFTLVMADMVGDTGQVHAFEPNPAIAEMLTRSVAVNGFKPRVHLHPEALGAVESDDFRLYVPPNYPGGGTVVPGASHLPGDGITVRRLDSYPELFGANIFKIDAEGGEETIWQGMRGILDQGRPLTILLEFVLARYADPAAFLDEILAAGFRLHEITDSHPIHVVTREDILGWPRDRDGMLVLIR